MALNFVRRDDLSDGDLKALLGQKERDHCQEVPRICARDEMLPKAVTVYSPPMTGNRPELPGSYRGFETVNPVVAQ